jgi:HSP20 family protein
MKNRSGDDGNYISIFGGLDKIINMIGNMVDNDKDELNLNGVIKPKGENKITGKYGINVKLGTADASGVERIKSLNDIFDKKENTSKNTEPATDAFEDDEKVTIVVELPGVEKKDIRLVLSGNTVSIGAMGGGVCYSKKVELKFSPDYNSIKENFNNSIYSLEISKKPAV